MNWQTVEAWWLAQSGGVRQALTALLAAVCSACAFLFLSYDLHSEHSAMLDRKELSIGKPDAWFHWLDSSNHDAQGFGSRRETSFRVFSLSFGAGAVSYACASLLLRIRRCGKSQPISRQ